MLTGYDQRHKVFNIKCERTKFNILAEFPERSPDRLLSLYIYCRPMRQPATLRLSNFELREQGFHFDSIYFKMIFNGSVPMVSI